MGTPLLPNISALIREVSFGMIEDFSLAAKERNLSQRKGVLSRVSSRECPLKREVPMYGFNFVCQ